jgi:hypothetical protein
MATIRGLIVSEGDQIGDELTLAGQPRTFEPQRADRVLSRTGYSNPWNSVIPFLGRVDGNPRDEVFGTGRVSLS